MRVMVSGNLPPDFRAPHGILRVSSYCRGGLFVSLNLSEKYFCSLLHSEDSQDIVPG